MLQLVCDNINIALRQMRVQHLHKQDKIHLTFDTNSSSTCYRKDEGDYTWYLRVSDDQAIGIVISSRLHVDWIGLRQQITQLTPLTDDDLIELFLLAKRFHRG